MIISYGYLQDILKKECPSVEELTKKFPEIGFEVENIFLPENNTVFTVKVIEKTDIPSTEHLLHATISDGVQTHQIVTSWKELRVGGVYLWAPPGTTIGGITLTSKDFQNVQSEGMLLSYVEVSLDNTVVSNQERLGPMELPPDTPIGKNFFDLFWLSFPTFDLKIPYNRPDCYSMEGLLREVTAAFDIHFPATDRRSIHHIYPPFKEVQIKRSVRNISFKGLKVLDSERCPIYLGALLGDVKIDASPFEIRRRLMAFRVRPVNNVVDCANIIMFYYQQPLHTFDLDRLMGHHIEVRTPLAPESFDALDGKTYTLTENDLVIADEVRPIAIAGVMGSSDSEIMDSTKNIFLECAYFQPKTISRTSARLHLVSDASSRYARGVDYGQLEDVMKITVNLMSSVCGGTIAGEFFTHRTTIQPPPDIDLSLQEFSDVTGIDISKFQASSILKKLEIPFENTLRDGLRIHPPSFRVDLHESVDIIEELLRFTGYHNIQPSKPMYQVEYKPEKPWIKMNRLIRQQMGALGFFEAMTDSFAKDEEVALLYPSDTPGLVQVENPLRKDQSYLTPNRILALLDIAKKNISKKNTNLRLYEIGNHYLQGENLYLDWLITGDTQCQTWCHEPRTMDFYFAKGIKENSVLMRYHIPFTTKPSENHNVFDPCQALDVIVEDSTIGTYGAVHPKLLQYFGIHQPVFFSCMQLNPIMKYLVRHGHYRPISAAQDVLRDIAFLVDRDIPAGQLVKTIQETAGYCIKKTIIFDLYQGKNIDTTKKSIAIRMMFNFGQNKTSEEIQEIMDDIVQSLHNVYNIEIRE
ncbi:MAG: phenylalanine--tRNA ligase subunit beta [Caldisericia bacterium]|nr:phenylalanine--tRNA ligase subunit beta [Caldisericia bacterium]MDD4614066.1 phenylalanine--tRNA ligase subunit beta [Caldisericia bacterium]